MNKLYDRIDFHNGSAPAINETNLNAMSKAIDDIDSRVADLYISQVDVEEVKADTALTKKYRDEAYATTPQGYADLVTDVAKLKTEVSNPNLLDNPFFTCNSRGLRSYSIGSGDGYSYDRWRIANYTSITNSNGIITFTSTQAVGAHLFGQLLGTSLGLGGKQVTISFLNTDGTVSSYSGIFNNQNTNEVMGIYQGLSVITRNHGTNYGFYLRKDSVDINISFKAIKIELGTVSTLANDSAPNTSEELLKCITSKADPSDTYANGKGMVFFGGSVTDLNGLINYPMWFGYLSGVANMPVTGQAFLVWSISSNGKAMQIAMLYHGYGTTDTYIRQYINSWSSWLKLN